MALTEAQTALVNTRKSIIRHALREEMTSEGYGLILQLDSTGELVHARNLMRIKAAIVDGNNLHKRKVWRLHAAELRYPSSSFSHNVHGATGWDAAAALMNRTWVETVVSGDPETWTPRPYTGTLIPRLDAVSDEVALAWIGVTGARHSYPNRADPHWTPASHKERTADAVKSLANGVDVAWRTENADRYNNTVLWIESLGGMTWKLASAASPNITVDVTVDGSITQQVLSGDDAREWGLVNLEAWAAKGTRSFFDNHPVVELKEKMEQRRVTLVDPLTNLLEGRLAVDLTTVEWAAIRGGDYRNAIAFDEDADQ